MTSNSQEAVVRVRLDTGQAKRDLDDLLNGKGGGGGVPGISPEGGGGGGGRGGGLGRGFGLGVGGALGLGAIKSSSMGALGDVAGEFIAPLGANLSNTFFGLEDDRARARATAREQTIAAFGQLARTNKEGAYQHFLGLSKIEEQKEFGASAIREDYRFYRGGDDFDERNNNFIDHIVSKVVGAIESGFNNIWNSIKSLIGI